MLRRNRDERADRDLVLAAEKSSSRSREPDDDLFKMQTNNDDDLQIWETKREEMEEVEGRRMDGAAAASMSLRGHAPKTTSKRIEILLDKDPSGEGFGFVLRGGAYCDPADGSLPLIVTKIIAGSPADREGTLQVGDRIIEINGLDMSRVTVQQAAAILTEAVNDVILLIEYDVAVLEWISNAGGPVLVEIEKPVGKVLDITLSSTTWNGFHVIYIDSVYEAGTADRSGAMHVGDHVRRIDGIPVGRKSVDEANDLLQSNKTERIQLEIFPISAQLNRETDLCGGGQEMMPTTVLASTGLPSYDSALLLEFETALVNETVSSSDDLSTCSAGQRFQQVSNQGAARPPPPHGSRSLTTLRGYTPPLQQMVTPRSATPPNSFHLRSFSPHGVSPHHPIRCSPSPSSSLSPIRSATPPVAFKAKKVISSSLGGLPNTGPGVPARTTSGFRRFSKGSLNHVDIAEVVLFGGPDGYGLDIEAVAVDDPTAKGSNGVSWPMVTRVEPRGEADRSGVIQEGDRVLAINGQSLRGRTNDDLQRMVNVCSPGVLRLLIEFDVADSIVVSCGTILVKLVKGGGSGLGLSLAYPEKRNPGDALIISDVKKGSVAHRVGALRAGDSLLAVDEVDVINSTAEHVTRMLLNCSDIVQLTIRKNESTTSETSRSNLVTFSVELPVHTGSQLGVILSAVSGPNSKKIIVSDIVEGSLLQRSGTLRVGDEVVSINGIPVDARSLDDAQRILSESEESVSIKIKRLPVVAENVKVSSRQGQKAQNSIDSAVESCDSSSTPNSDTTTTTITTNYAAAAATTSSLSASASSNPPQEPLPPPPPIPPRASSPHLPPPLPPQHPSHQQHPPQHPTQHPSQHPSQPQHPSQHHPRPQQLLQRPRNCNELKITAEIHSFAEDIPSPVIGSAADHSPQHHHPSDDNRLPVHVVPSLEDEWSRRLDDLDGDTVFTDDCILGDSFSRLPTNIDAGDVRNRSGVTSETRHVNDVIDECDMTNRSGVTSSSSQPCSSVKCDDNVVRKDADDSDCNGGKTEDKFGRPRRVVTGNVFVGLAERKATQIRNWNRSDAYDFDAIESGEPEVSVSHAQSIANRPEVELARHRNHVTEGATRGIELVDAFDRKDMAQPGELNQLEELLESIFTPTPVELLKVILYKVRSSDDFGFSLSDGVYEKGVYVSGVKPGGPASEGLLPYDKILQINHVKTKELDCHQVVPLIAEAGNRVELIVCRNALATSLPRDRSRDGAAAGVAPPRGVRAGSSPPQSGSAWKPGSKVDPLWKPRVRRRVNFLSKNSVF